MNELWRYSIRIKEQIDRDDINRISPVKVNQARIENSHTMCELTTDQAGLIGVLRHLHQRGFTIIGVHRLVTEGMPGGRND